MLAQPSMIKRPVLDIGGKLVVGFKPEVYAPRRSPGEYPSSLPRSPE